MILLCFDVKNCWKGDNCIQLSLMQVVLSIVLRICTILFCANGNAASRGVMHCCTEVVERCGIRPSHPVVRFPQCRYDPTSHHLFKSYRLGQRLDFGVRLDEVHQTVVALSQFLYVRDREASAAIAFIQEAMPTGKIKNAALHCDILMYMLFPWACDAVRSDADFGAVSSWRDVWRGLQGKTPSEIVQYCHHVWKVVIPYNVKNMLLHLDQLYAAMKVRCVPAWAFLGVWSTFNPGVALNVSNEYALSAYAMLRDMSLLRIGGVVGREILVRCEQERFWPFLDRMLRRGDGGQVVFGTGVLAQRVIQTTVAHARDGGVLCNSRLLLSCWDLLAALTKKLKPFCAVDWSQVCVSECPQVVKRSERHSVARKSGREPAPVLLNQYCLSTPKEKRMLSPNEEYIYKALDSFYPSLAAFIAVMYDPREIGSDVRIEVKDADLVFQSTLRDQYGKILACAHQFRGARPYLHVGLALLLDDVQKSFLMDDLNASLINCVSSVLKKQRATNESVLVMANVGACVLYAAANAVRLHYTPGGLPLRPRSGPLCVRSGSDSPVVSGYLRPTFQFLKRRFMDDAFDMLQQHLQKADAAVISFFKDSVIRTLRVQLDLRGWREWLLEADAAAAAVVPSKATILMPATHTGMPPEAAMLLGWATYNIMEGRLSWSLLCHVLGALYKRLDYTSDEEVERVIFGANSCLVQMSLGSIEYIAKQQRERKILDVVGKIQHRDANRSLQTQAHALCFLHTGRGYFKVNRQRVQSCVSDV